MANPTIKKPSRLRKLTLVVELEPQDAEAFRKIAKDLNASSVASALMAFGIRDYLNDPELVSVLIQKRLNKFTNRASNKKRVLDGSRSRKRVVVVKKDKDMQNIEKPVPQKDTRPLPLPPDPPPPPPPPPPGYRW